MKVSTQGLGGGRTRARTWDPMIKSLLLRFIATAKSEFCVALLDDASRACSCWLSR
jgi:hypothetical protein